MISKNNFEILIIDNPNNLYDKRVIYYYIKDI